MFAFWILKYTQNIPDDGVEYFVIVYHNVKQAGLPTLVCFYSALLSCSDSLVFYTPEHTTTAAAPHSPAMLLQ